MPRGVRRRYLALKLVSDGSVRREELMNAIWDAIIQLWGEYGASQTDLALIRYSSERDYAILRCSHKALEMVKAEDIEHRGQSQQPHDHEFAPAPVGSDGQRSYRDKH